MQPREISIKIVESDARNVRAIVSSVRAEAKKRRIAVSDTEYDVVVSVGGDGTLCKAVKLGKPVMAVMGGRRNYHPDIPPEKVGEALSRLLKGDYAKSRYGLLDVRARSARSLAFNEVGVLSRQPQTVLLGVSCLDYRVEFEGDGALVATPQGSTGWSFSAQGTYLDRRTDSLVITALNPVLMPLRSLVVPNVPVTIEMEDRGYDLRANLLADGSFISELGVGERVRISRHDKDAVIYRFFPKDPMTSLLGSRLR
jgi:NAD+ kinase